MGVGVERFNIDNQKQFKNKFDLSSNSNHQALKRVLAKTLLPYGTRSLSKAKLITRSPATRGIYCGEVLKKVIFDTSLYKNEKLTVSFPHNCYYRVWQVLLPVELVKEEQVACSQFATYYKDQG